MMQKTMTKEEFDRWRTPHFERAYLPPSVVFAAAVVLTAISIITATYVLLILSVPLALVALAWCFVIVDRRSAIWNRDFVIDLLQDAQKYLPIHHTTTHLVLSEVSDRWDELPPRSIEALFEPAYEISTDFRRECSTIHDGGESLPVTRRTGIS